MACTRGSRGCDLGRSQAARRVAIAVRGAYRWVPTFVYPPSGDYLLAAYRAVTASVQLVGVNLVFTSLIVPALAVRGLRTALRLPVAYAIGALGYLLALAPSARFDLPSGAVIVLVMAAVAPLAPWLAAPRRNAGVTVR
jgi:hypothetical protein